MPTLFLSAPEGKTQVGTHRRDFYTILANGVGPDYAIYTNLIGQIHSGMAAVVFDRDRSLQAEGVVASYTATTKTGNRVQRYDVHIRKLAHVPYTNPPQVNRCGVAVA
jgi:hypothetical protein